MKLFIRLILWALALSLLTGLALALEEEPEAPPPLVYQVTTPKGQLNVRIRPQAGSRVVDKLSNRSLVRVLGEEGGFYQVALKEEQTGWVAREFLVPTDYGLEVLAYRPMQVGSRGEDVSALKERLLALRYYRDSQGMTDIYNATCVQRVKLF